MGNSGDAACVSRAVKGYMLSPFLPGPLSTHAPSQKVDSQEAEPGGHANSEHLCFLSENQHNHPRHGLQGQWKGEGIPEGFGGRAECPTLSCSLATDLSRGTFCRGRGGSRHSGEHSLKEVSWVSERLRREWARAHPTGISCLFSPPCADCGGPLASALLLLQTLGPPLNCRGPWQNPSEDERGWKDVRATMLLTRTPHSCAPLLDSYLRVPEGQERDERGGGLGICRQAYK